MIDDRDLERLAKHLGHGAGEGVDPEQMAESVVARLRQEGTTPPWWSRPATRRLAAAAVLVAAAGLFVARSGLDRPPSQLTVAVQVPATLDELAATELVEIIDSLQVEGPVHELVPASLDDLSERQLERLLEVMEG